MKTFLKVLLVILVAIVAIKLLPLTLAIGCVLAVGIAFFAAIGVSLVALGICAALALLAVLAPIWIPVLMIVGIVALIKKLNRNTSTTPPVIPATTA